MYSYLYQVLVLLATSHMQWLVLLVRPDYEVQDRHPYNQTLVRKNRAQEMDKSKQIIFI